MQGYVYGALLARHYFAVEQGDTATAERYRAKAVELKRRSTRTSGSRTAGGSPMGLDADKRPIDALASNMGHCLWTGIVDEDKAPRWPSA